MDDLAEFLKARTGWNVTTTELVRLHNKYFDTARQGIDYNRLMDDLKEGIDIKERSNYLDGEALHKQRRHMNFNQIIELLQSKILTRIETLRGENQLKKAYLLLGESRSPVVTRQQLKIACQSRLSIFLNDGEIEEVFNQLDKDRAGTINIRQLISLILKRETEDVSMSISMSQSERKHKTRNTSVDDNQNASITYDKKFKDLVAPDPARCRMFSMQEIEAFIFDRIFERSNLNENLLKTTTKLFGDGENTNGYHVITLDMMRYTLWKRLKMNISDEDVKQFYKRHAKGPNGTILLFDFIEAIISRRQSNTPLLDDRSHVDKSDRHKLTATMQENHNIEFFLIYVRRKLNDLINRESRAPHYLLHGNTRMTETQAKEFFKSRLNVDLDDQSIFSPALKTMVLQEYRSNSLVDTRRILLEAMAIKEEKVRSLDDLVGSLPNQTLLNGASVCVDRMPQALSKARMSPEKIEELIFHKCTERLKNDHPHASLHRMFREDGDARVITRKGMKTVFYKFDIVMSPEEFDEFYAKHDRGDGKIDIHTFLRCLMPPVNADVSPFVPKDPAKVKMETTLSQVMEEMTGRRHEVSWLNGPSSARTQPEFLQSLKPSSSGMNISPRRPSTSNHDSLHNSNNNNNTSSTTSLASTLSTSQYSEQGRNSPRPNSSQLHSAMPKHKSMSILQTTASENPNWNQFAATPSTTASTNNNNGKRGGTADNHQHSSSNNPAADDLFSVSSTAMSATPASTTAGLTEQIQFAEALLKALKDLPAYKQQQELLASASSSNQTHVGSTSTLKQQRPVMSPSAPASPAPSRQGANPRANHRPLSASTSLPSSAASSPAKTVTIAATNNNNGSRAVSEKAAVALDTVPEEHDSSPNHQHQQHQQHQAYHLHQSEQLLALAEAYARATGVLSDDTAADQQDHSSVASAKTSASTSQNNKGKKVHPDALKINLGKMSERFVAPDASTANLTHLLEQSSLLNANSPRVSKKNINTINFLETSAQRKKASKNQGQHPHRPATAPSAPSAHAANHAKSSPSFHFKHLKVNQPVIDPYSPPAVTGTTAFNTQKPHNENTFSGSLTSRTQNSDAHTVASNMTSRSSKSKKHLSQNQQSKRTIDTGMKHSMPINPYTEGLLDDYRLRKKILVTSNQEYGLFVKNLNRAIKQRAKLVNRLEKEEQQSLIRRNHNNNYDEEEEGEEEEEKNSSGPATHNNNHTMTMKMLSPRSNKAATLTMIRSGNVARPSTSALVRPTTVM